MRQTLKTHKRSGIALVAAMIFISVFMAATMGMLSMSSQNTIAASNLHKANMTRSTAESGLEIVRYWMQQADTSGAESEEDAFLLALDALETGLASAHVTFSNIYNPQNEWVGRYGSPSEGSIYIEAKKRQPVLSDWRQCQHLRQCQHRQP